MLRIKVIEFTTDLLLTTVLIGIFVSSFILTIRLNPKSNIEPVLGLDSYEIEILSDDKTEFKIIRSTDRELEFNLTIHNDENLLVNDHTFMVIRNKEDFEKRYAIYFEIEKADFQDTQLFLKAQEKVTSIFEARTHNLNIKDQLLIVDQGSLTKYELRSVSLSEIVPASLDLNVKIVKIN